MVYDAIIVSDIHLGSRLCLAKQFQEFLEQIRSGELKTSELILNGDIFESHDFRRLKKSHWKVLSTLRKMSNKFNITWIEGNHDGPIEYLTHLLGIKLLSQKIIRSGNHKILILHGHIFDNYIVEHPMLSWVADVIYHVAQRINKRLARFLKQTSKTLLFVCKKIEHESKELATNLGCDAVCVGHTHYETAKLGTPGYYNSGSWTEYPGCYLTIHNGIIELHYFETENEDALETSEPDKQSIITINICDMDIDD